MTRKPSVPQIACIARINENNMLSFETHDISSLTIAPTPKSLTPPAGDGVYSGDGSPAIGAYRWNKKEITYCLVEPDANNKIVNIPNDHDLAVSVNTALSIPHLFADIHATRIADWTKADISIKVDRTDPIFTPPAGLKVSSVMAYCHFPGTTPAGQFTCVLNPDILYSETGKFNFTYNINQTLRHECAGHGTGCVHTSNPKDLMYPFAHNDLIPTAMDIYQWQAIYGPRNPPMNPEIIKNFFVADANEDQFPDKPQ